MLLYSLFLAPHLFFTGSCDLNMTHAASGNKWRKMRRDDFWKTSKTPLTLVTALHSMIPSRIYLRGKIRTTGVELP